MSFLQPYLLLALPVVALPIVIHLINQQRFQTRRWAAMMFLLAANRMNKGVARIRQWLILAMRTLSVAALIFAIARPLSSGVLGMTGGGKADTTIVLIDRSPSMQQLVDGQRSKLELGRQQLGQTLATLGSTHWIAIDSVSNEARPFDSLEALMNSTAVTPSSTMTSVPSMLQASLDFLQANRSGPTEIWICSDLRQADWDDASGSWSVLREGFATLPQSVRFHLLGYPNQAESNMSIRVTEVRRETTQKNGLEENSLLLSLAINRPQSRESAREVMQVPVQIEIDGRRSELAVPLQGSQADVKQQRLPLSKDQQRGWGRVSIPADSQNEDNEFYFVFDEPPVRRVVVVSDDSTATRPLEIAAAIAADGSSDAMVEILTPDQLDSLALDDASLLLWQASLPDSTIEPAILQYINQGGQVVFFPPSTLSSGLTKGLPGAFMGVRWNRWTDSDSKVMVENWRGDQDLFAATESGSGLPVGQLELSGFASLQLDTESITLASLTGGNPLLVRLPTTHGGVYFMTASSDPNFSSLASNGIVLFVALQRAIERGRAATGNTLQRIAGRSDESTNSWRQIAGRSNALSTEFESQAGVYQTADRLVAVNRSLAEDQLATLEDSKIQSLFAGLSFSSVIDSSGSMSAIVREVWRVFLISMIVALLVEASLCLPRRTSK